MIATSAAYKAAVTGDKRKTLVRAVVDLISPDIVYGAATSSGESTYSQSAQLHDKITELSEPYITLEQNRWLLDGTWELAPPKSGAQVGYESDELSGADGTCNIWVQLNFSGVTVLQACSLYFPTDDYNGYPVNFTVEIYSGATAAYTQTFEGNANRVIKLTGFTVSNPTAIRLTVTVMSLPYRRLRVPEIIAGVYEIWGNDELAGFAIAQKADLAAVSVPYGTCRLTINNADKRFSPRNKSGLFLSLEERQGIQTYIGFDGAEYVPTGTYYQYSGGWSTAGSGLTMDWSLVDIIGLLASRKYPTTGTLPITLEEWVASCVALLGTNFAGKYRLDSGIDGTRETLATAGMIEGATCGQILMWICQIVGCYMMADNSTGELVLTKAAPTGNEYTLNNLSRYPAEKANGDIASITISLNPDSSSVATFAGTGNASPTSISIDNPFVWTSGDVQTAATAIAAYILQSFGGNQIETIGRGDPSSELGDTATVQFADGETEQGRIVAQDYKLTGGVMRDCKTTMIEIQGGE